MKKAIIILLSLFAVHAASAQLPDVSIENAQGETISTKSLLQTGKPMILSFWSTTCKSCIQELRAISDNMEDWLEEADFSVVAVSVDDARSSTKARTLASGNGWDDFVLLFDKNQDFKRAMNVNLIPHVFVVDAEGNVVYSHTSYTPGSEIELIKKIKQIQ